MSKGKKWYRFIWDDGPSSFLHALAVAVPAVFLGTVIPGVGGLIVGLLWACGGVLFYYDREYGLKKGDYRHYTILKKGYVLADYWKAKAAQSVERMKDAQADFRLPAIGGVLAAIIVVGRFLGW